MAPDTICPEHEKYLQDPNWLDKRLSQLDRVMDDLEIFQWTEEDRMNHLKKSGNEEFKKKKYRKAIEFYNSALAIKSSDTVMNCELLNNISASNFYLGNFQESLDNALLCLSQSKDKQKCLMRAVNCTVRLHLYDSCIKCCDQYEQTYGICERIEIIRKEANEQLKRKNELKQKRKELVDAIKSRGVKLLSRKEMYESGSELETDDEGEDELKDMNDSFKCESIGLPRKYSLLNKIEPHHNVYLDKSGLIHWPAIILYPEFNHVDMIQDIPENYSLEPELMEVMREGLPWTRNPAYNISEILIFLIDQKSNAYPIDPKKSIGEVLSCYGHAMLGGRPVFHIITPKSEYYEIFRSQYKVCDSI